MATAGDQINRALRILGVLAEDESPSASTANDALVAFNQMLDSWSAERLSVFNTITQTFTWPAAQVSRTLGPTGDFVGTRPVLLDPSTYYVLNGISYQIEQVNQEQYNSIILKTSTSPVPVAMFVNESFPNIEIFLFPVPSSALTFKLVSIEVLDQIASLTADLEYPPGYLRAVTYNLAVELASEFGMSASDDVKRIARNSKRNIRRINNPGDVLAMPTRILANQCGFNIYTGGFN